MTCNSLRPVATRRLVSLNDVHLPVRGLPGGVGVVLSEGSKVTTIGFASPVARNQRIARRIRPAARQVSR